MLIYNDLDKEKNHIKKQHFYHPIYFILPSTQRPNKKKTFENTREATGNSIFSLNHMNNGQAFAYFYVLLQLHFKKHTSMCLATNSK